MQSIKELMLALLRAWLLGYHQERKLLWTIWCCVRLEAAYSTWNAIGASQCKCPRGKWLYGLGQKRQNHPYIDTN